MNRRGGVLSALPAARSVGPGPALSGERVALSVLSLPVKALSLLLCPLAPDKARLLPGNSRQAPPVTFAASGAP